MTSSDTSSSVIEAYARLLSLAVHEFRTPASVVGGYLRMLQHDTESPLGERQRKMVDEAEKSCGRLVALISELSEVSKLDAGTAAVQQERFDLFDVLSDVAAGVHEAEDRGITLRISGPSNGAPMSGDLTRLRTAFAACFRAVLREQASGTVVADRRRVKNGAGAAALVVVAGESQLDQSSDGEGPFDEHRGGLGLALPIARRVIERHGGRVWSSGPQSKPFAINISLPIHD